MTTYGTVADADAYHLARGNAAWASATDKPKKLLVASEYIDTYRARFPGSKSGGRAQEREWPRRGAVDSIGEPIADDEIPKEVEYATYEAALLVAQGISLTQVPASSYSSAVVSRKRVKAGPVETETEYNTTQTNGRPSFQKIDDLLANVLTGAMFGAMVGLLRG